MDEGAVVAAVQMTSGDDVAKNLDRAAFLVRRAVARGARLVVNARVPADVLTLTQAAVIVAVGALGAASLRHKESQ